MMSLQFPIGGFFPLELPSCTSGAGSSGGLLQAWTGGLPFAAFGNARSALSALIARIKPPRVWLPSFVCTAVAEGVPQSLRRFYAVDCCLTSDTDKLAQASAGDVVLGVNYFGFSPGKAFLRFVSARPDLVFVEDCAHCAVPGPAWGNWRLFSPRKVVGVADGGILVGMRSDTVPPQPTAEPDDAHELWRAPLLRFENPRQEGSAQWHPANQAKEAAMRVSSVGATRLSLALLCLHDPQEIARRRRENFAMLQAALGEHLLPLRAAADSVPFAFPVRLAPQQRDTVLCRLHAKGIFSAVHWDTLPVAQPDFQPSHLLSRSLISLPCDQRYEAAHMKYMAEIFRQALE